MSDGAKLRDALRAQFPNNFELDVGAGGTPILTVVDKSFSGLSRADRLDRIHPLMRSAGFADSIGIIELYSPKEATDRGIEISIHKITPPATWEAAVSMVESGQTVERTTESRKPRRVVFYSYKGGVGRTTALVHTAFHLARSGQRVVVVDLDVEAPGLHAALPRPDGTPVKAGLVDYLWERQVKPFEPTTGEGLDFGLVEGSCGGRHAISYVVEDLVSRAQIQVIPAGAVGVEYVRRLSTLSSQDALTRNDDAWSLFEKELAEQLEPDVLLIDSRTGLGDWGGLSVLRLADEAFLVLYPSDQNGEGIRFVREMVRGLGGAKMHLVLSPIPEGPIGRELVARFLPKIGLDEDEQPIEIHYNPSVAGALRLPVESAMAGYAKIGNLLLESSTEDKVEATIQHVDRWRLIESLKFPERDAKAIVADAFELFFQKTSDFDKFLDDARWVVRGRKGTGKSTLFHLFVEHHENAIKRARGKLEGIDVLAGHGPAPGAAFRPTTDIFGTIAKGLGKHDWLSFWRAYALVRIWGSKSSGLLDTGLKRPEMRELRNHLTKVFPRNPSAEWRSAHTKGLLALVGDPLNGLCRDLFGDLNRGLAESSRKLWLLYDDLDQDIMEESSWQGEALGGLLRLAYDSNNHDLRNVRFKVFLREDIWSKLVFTNKSHFGDPRTLLLQWKIDDFLRLAFRLAVGGSAEFRSMAEREFPLTEAELDNANEEGLRRALAPLWGLNQEKGKKAFAARWVYSRMTDAAGNTYPRSLTVLLRAACEEELRGRNKPAPKDRLLSPRAMLVGLAAASVERVDALKNEYPRLKPFLEDVKKANVLRSQFKKEELRGVWERTSKKLYPQFEQFVAQLELAGLLEKRNGEKFDYGFASLYIDGLAVVRVQGEKK